MTEGKHGSGFLHHSWRPFWGLLALCPAEPSSVEWRRPFVWSGGHFWSTTPVQPDHNTGSNMLKSECKLFFLHETSRLAVPGTHVFIFSWIPDLDIQVHHDLFLKKLRIFKKASTGKHWQRLANTGKHGGNKVMQSRAARASKAFLCLHEVHNEVTNYIVRKYMDSF